MACKVERFQSIGKGRGLQATSLASPGEVLYVAEPFAYTVRDVGYGKLCEFCLSTPNHLLQCSRCKFAKYCGKQCQVAAWPDHKRECKCLKTFQFNFDIDLVRLVGRMFFKILQKTPCPSEKLCSVFELESNLEKLSRELQDKFVSNAKLLRLYIKEEIPADINLIDLYAKMITNRFIVVSAPEPSVVGLYPSMSLLNHSCEPNCSVVFIGRYFQLRAIREIQAGEELTIAYIKLLMPTEERQSELRYRYCFECDCRRCRTCDKDDKMLAGDKQRSEETKELAKKVEELQSDHLWEESLALCKTQLQRNTGRVPDENIYQLNILNYAMEACMHLNRIEEGLQYGNRSLEPYRMYATGISALGAEQLYYVSSMLISQGKIEEGVNNLKEVYKVLKVFYGTDNRMTRSVMTALQQAHAL